MRYYSIRHRALSTLALLAAFGAIEARAMDQSADLSRHEDSAITREVRETLAQDPQIINKQNINVSTVNGVVSLNGLVDTRSERANIVTKVSQIPGVKSVNDGISISSTTG